MMRVIWESACYFHDNTKEPYYQDSVIFTGLMGEYEYKVKVEKRENDREGGTINMKQEPKKFMLIPPQFITHAPVPLFKNPVDKE